MNMKFSTQVTCSLGKNGKGGGQILSAAFALPSLLLLKRRRVSFARRKRIRSGVRHREIHLCRFGRSKIAV